jgi:voltage-gated potassium channel
MGLVIPTGRAPMPLVRLVARPAARLIAVILAGVLGYCVIEGWSLVDALWMVGITVSTIGYGEVHPLSATGRMFTLVLIGTSLFVAGQAAAEIGAALGEDGLTGTLRARRARRELSRMKDHVIVIGYGRLGREIVADLLHHGTQVVIIDPAPPKEEPPYGVILLLGDATHDAVLREANVESARAVAIATPSDAVNVYLTLTVRQLNPTVVIATRVEEDGASTKALRAGATRVLQPYHLSGTRMAQALLRPGSAAFLDRAMERQFEDLHIDDVIVPAGSPMLGPLRDARARERFGVLIVARCPAGANHVALAEPDEAIRAHDTLVVLGPPEKVRAFRAWVRDERPT